MTAAPASGLTAGLHGRAALVRQSSGLSPHEKARYALASRAFELVTGARKVTTLDFHLW